MRFKQSIPYKIEIDPTPNDGFIVTVGCVKAAYSGITKLIQDLTEYLENPEGVEKQYNHDIASLGRVHIRNIPDIQVRDYETDTPVFSGAAMSQMADDMVRTQEQREAERKNPQVVVNPSKENEP